MEIVITQGTLQLSPIPGPPREEEGEPEYRQGYILNVQDSETRTMFRIVMPPREAQRIAEALLADAEATEVWTPVEVVQGNGPLPLRDHLGPGGVPRSR